MIATRDEEGTMGVDEYARLPDDGYRAELVRGTVVREPQPGLRHGDIQARLAAVLVRWIDEHRPDLACVGPIGFVLGRHPATVRGPDLAVLATRRFPAADHPGFVEGAPELVIEIVSPSNRAADIRERVADFLHAGARLVWVIDPGSRSATVHEPDGPTRHLTSDDHLDGRDLLPGLRVPVASLFRA